MNKLVNGVVVAMTDAEITARNAEIAEIEKEEAANSYKRKRANEYPSVGDQLDMQYWDKKNGTTTWVDAITKVKSDNPKP
jgi:hypothetical protein